MREVLSIIFTNKRTLRLLSYIVKIKVLEYRNSPCPQGTDSLVERHGHFQYRAVNDMKDVNSVWGWYGEVLTTQREVFC